MKQRSILILEFVLFLGLTLSGCGSLPDGTFAAPTPTLDAQAVATTVANLVNTQTAQIEPTVTLPAVVATPSLLASSESGPAPQQAATSSNCNYLPAEMVDQPLPEANLLVWSTNQDAAGRWLNLEGFSSPVLDAEPAPGGRWWAARVLRRAVPAGPWETALYILDGASNQHWRASLQGSSSDHQYVWLADGQLVWVDEQRLWLAHETGADRRDLNAPEPVVEVWLGAEGRLLVSGASGLWRFNLAEEDWSPVPELGPLATLLGAPAFSGTRSNLSVVPDGSAAVLITASSNEISNAQVWLLPFDPAQPARLVAEVSYLGSGGRMPAPHLVGNGQTIEPGQPVGRPGVFDVMERVLLPMNGQEWVRLSDLLPEGQALLDVQTSPDGQWLALINAPQAANPSDAAWSVEFVTANELEPLTTLPGDTVLGWRAFPATAWLVESSPTGQVIRQVALPVGDAQVLDELPGEVLPAVVPATQALFLFTTDQLQIFAANGQRGSVYPLPLPLPLISIYARQASITNQVLLTGTTAEEQQSQCTFRFPVILWSPGPP